MRDTYIPQGIVFKSDVDKKKTGHFSLTKWLRETLLGRIVVPHYDTCCNKGSVEAPVGYHPDNGLVRYNSSTKEYVEIPLAATTGYSGNIVATEGTYTFTNGILTNFVPS
ncbi:hypothetical protein [Leptolyngbya phage Lbo-JY46]